MTTQFPHIDSVELDESDLAAITHGRNALADFQLWATKEMRVLSLLTSQTRKIIGETRKLLAHPDSHRTPRKSNRRIVT